MRGVPQASLSRLPSRDLGLRRSFRPAVLARVRRRSLDRLETVERFRRQRRHFLRAGSESRLSRQWLRRF